MLDKFFKSSSDTKNHNGQHTPLEPTAEQALEQELQQVATIVEPQALAKLATLSGFTRVRQAAAERITDIPVLHELEKLSQDKSVQHIVREKIRQHKQAQADQQQAGQHIDSLCEKLEHLARSSHSPLFKPQYEHQMREWQELGDELHLAFKFTAQPRFDAAKTACDQVLEMFAAEEARLQEQRDAEAALAAQTQQEKEAQKAVWDKLAEEQKAEQEQADLKKQQEDEQKKKRDREQAQLEEGLKGILPAIELALQNGQVNHAAKKIKNAQGKLEQLDKALAHSYEGRLQLLNKQLAELRDWQGFAAIPKKQELIVGMQKLADAPLLPAELVTAIHDLQEQWRNLKGGGLAEEQTLWVQFKEAADKAYEPCKIHFEEQKNLRAENLKQREQICQQLEGYCSACDWEKVDDWKAVEKIIETAKKEFHRFSPVDHKQLAVIKERFEAALAPIVEKLRIVQKQNEAQKHQLIEQTRKLMETTDTRAAIEAAKKMQADWKTIGITRHHEDQKLWQQFRAACDAVFARRDAEKKQFTDTLQQDIAKAEDLCKQIELLAALPDSELQKSRDQYQNLRNQFQSIASLSKEKQKKQFRLFYQACDHYQARVDGIKDRKQQSAMQEVFRKATLCAQLESGALNADDAQAQWASPEGAVLGAEHSAVLDKRFANAQKIARGEQKADFAANDRARRLILIRLEMLKNKETPVEDKALRMEYSLKQLSGGFGKKTLDPKLEMQTLTLEWLAAPIGLPEHRDALQQRFDGLVK
jgi:hypothetical protein